MSETTYVVPECLLDAEAYFVSAKAKADVRIKKFAKELLTTTRPDLLFLSNGGPSVRDCAILNVTAPILFEIRTGEVTTPQALDLFLKKFLLEKVHGIRNSSSHIENLMGLEMLRVIEEMIRDARRWL